MVQVGPDRVRISGATGTPATGLLKVSLGYVDSYVGEGQISYAGPGALARGRLARDVVRERLALTGVATSELRCDLIGVDALHGEVLPRTTKVQLSLTLAEYGPPRPCSSTIAGCGAGPDGLNR